MPATESPREVLVLEAGGIGDAVLATPALVALRERLPDARVTVVCVPRAAEVIKSLELGFAVQRLRLGMPFSQLADAVRLVWRCRRRRPDVLVDLSSIESDGAAGRRRRLVRWLRPRRSLGRNTEGRGWFFDAAAEESLAGGPHEVERKLAVLAPLGIRVEAPRARVGIGAEAANSASRLLGAAGVVAARELVGLNPGAFLTTRRWPVENFVRLAGALSETAGRALLVTGGEPERELVAQVVRAARGPAFAAVGRPLSEAAALVRACRVFVTNDTGLMHVAAALNVPTVALFGRTNLERYRPFLPVDRCIVFQQPYETCVEFKPGDGFAECRRPNCPDHRCMRLIPFDAVHAAVLGLLKATSRAQSVVSAQRTADSEEKKANGRRGTVC